MKTKIWLASLSAALLMNVGFNPVGSPRLTLLGGATAYAQVRVGIDYFYNELAPYGDWRRSESYGWVWYPEVASDWRPYTVGYWVFTDDFGWTWVSTERWGSMPFHYGRWFYDEDYEGWAWVPGAEWGPAWVSWRSGGGFIGWAPLPPSVRFEPDVGFAAQGQEFNPGRRSWCFVPTQRFLSPNLRRSILPPPRNAALIDSTVNVTRYTVVDRRVVNRSIDLGHFEQETRKPVVRYRPIDVERPVMGKSPVRGRQIDLFRPQVVGTTAVPPPPRVDRSPRHDSRSDRSDRSDRPDRSDRSPDHQAPATTPWEHRTGVVEQGGRDRAEPAGPGRPWPDDPDTGEIGKRGGPRLPSEQDRPLPPRMVEPGGMDGRPQPNGQERNGSWEQGRGRQKATDLQQQQMEQEKARQQDMLRLQQQQQHQQAEQEKARQQAILQQQQQQQRQQQVEQQRQQQVEQQRQQQKLAEPMRRLPDCKSLPPGQQQECR